VAARARGDSTRFNIICPALVPATPAPLLLLSLLLMPPQPLGMLVRVPAHHTLISSHRSAAGRPTALMLATLPT